MATTVVKDSAVNAAAFNRYVIDFADEWQEPLKQSLQLEKILEMEGGVKYCTQTYAAPTRKIEGVVQGYQGVFTPKGSVFFGSRQNELQRLKSDLSLDEEMMEIFWSSAYPQYEGSVNDRFEDNPFIQDVLNEMYFNQWTREMRQVEVKGVKQAIVPGTASTVLGSINGFEKIFADDIAAGKLNTIVTGTLTKDNIVEKVQTALESIDPDFWEFGINIYMSPQQALWFSRQYKKDHPYAQSMVNDPTAPALYVDDFNAKIHRLNARQGATNFWIDCKVDGKSNMIVLKHKTKSDMPTLEFFDKPRGLDVTANWHRGYGLNRYEYTYVTKVA